MLGLLSGACCTTSTMVHLQSTVRLIQLYIQFEFTSVISVVQLYMQHGTIWLDYSCSLY